MHANFHSMSGDFGHGFGHSGPAHGMEVGMHGGGGGGEHGGGGFHGGGGGGFHGGGGGGSHGGGGGGGGPPSDPRERPDKAGGTQNGTRKRPPFFLPRANKVGVVSLLGKKDMLQGRPGG